jgi:hypothetical protein
VATGWTDHQVINDTASIAAVIFTAELYEITIAFGELERIRTKRLWPVSRVSPRPFGGTEETHERQQSRKLVSVPLCRLSLPCRRRICVSCSLLLSVGRKRKWSLYMGVSETMYGYRLLLLLLLTPWYKSFLEKLLTVQLVKEFPPQGFYMTFHYRLHKAQPQNLIPRRTHSTLSCYMSLRFFLILSPSTFGSHKWSLFFRFSD